MSTVTERKAYASDLTNEQWLLLEPLLPKQKEGGRDRHIDLREIAWLKGEGDDLAYKWSQ